jgi:uncharacterized protein DUF3558
VELGWARMTWLPGLLALVLLAGCGSNTTNGTSSTPVAPTIAGDPLNLSKQAAAPCGLLTADQLAQYHLTAPGQVTGGWCAWTPTTARLPSYSASVDMTSGGLAGLYAERSGMRVFRPIQVGEYPAVNTGSQLAGHCTVEVGVADDTLIIANTVAPRFDQSDYPDPCHTLDQFALVIVGDAQGRVA